MAELKPCPFCGSEAEYRPAGGISETNGYVRCKNFCCEQHWYSPKEEAIEAWNRRAEDAVTTEQLEEILRDLERMFRDGK